MMREAVALVLAAALTAFGEAVALRWLDADGDLVHLAEIAFAYGLSVL